MLMLEWLLPILLLALVGLVVLRYVYRQGYTDGVADMQQALEDSLKRKFGKEARDA